MATVSDLINSTYRHLYGSSRQEINQLAAGVDTVTTTLQFTYDTAPIAQGDYLSADDEIMYVWSTQTASKTVTVQRGMAGSSPAVHTGGIVVERNPRFPKFAVRAALKDELQSWGERVWATDTIDIKVTRNHRSVDLIQLADNFLYGLELVRSPKTGSDAYTKVQSWTIQRAVPQAVYLQKTALFLASPPVDDWTGTLTYALPFNVEQFSDTISLENTVRLPAEFQDIPPLGAVARLMIGRDVLRTFTEAQGEPRDAAEVATGQMTAIATRFRTTADMRLSQATRTLLGRYPWRKA